MKKALLMVCAMALPVSATSAQSTTPAAPVAAPAPDSEEQVDDGLKRLGYLSGLARGCVADAQQVALEKEVSGLNNSIARLLGTDRAFLFSTAYGYGTSVKIEVKDCKEVMTTYEARVEKFRAGQGGSQ